MDQKEEPKLVVALADATALDPSGRLRKDIAERVNDLQEGIVAVTNDTSEYSLKVTLWPGKGESPYYRSLYIQETDPDTTNQVFIDIEFYQVCGMTLHYSWYYCYVLSIIILEYLYRRETGSEYRILRPIDYPNMNRLAWNGSIPPHADQTFQTFTSRADRPGLGGLIDDTVKLRQAANPLLAVLHQSAGQIADYLRRLAIPSNFGAEQRVLPTFMAANQVEVQAVTQQINSDAPRAMIALIDLLKATPSTDSLELLKGLAEASGLKRETRDQARAAAGAMRQRLLVNDPTEQHTQAAKPNKQVDQSADMIQSNAEISAEAEIAPPTETAHTGSFGHHSDSTAGPDLLGYNDYAEAIADVVTHPKTETPLTIAIGAPWGRGKTKLLDLIEEAVNKRAGDNDRATCHSIRINAWELAKTKHIWAEFYGRLLDQIEDNLGFWKSRWLRVRFSFRSSKLTTFTFLLIALLLATGTYIYLPRAIAWVLSGEVPGWAKNLSAFSTFILSVLSMLWRPISKLVFRGLEGFAKPKAPGTEQEVLKNTGIVGSILQKMTDDRFLISVDDIDRCDPEKTLEVLEAIKLFLDTNGFVFFLAMDCRVVMKAVGVRYKFMSKDGENSEDMGRQYLEKIIQVPFHLPALSGLRLKELNRELLKPLLNESVPEPISVSPPVDAQPPKNSPTPAKKGISKESDEDIVETDLRNQIELAEYRAILGFLDKLQEDMSPRLFKRFVSVYLIARNMYINWRKRLDHENTLPPAGFTHWLAISVLYPVEAKCFLSWPEASSWSKPPPDIPIDDLTSLASLAGKNGIWKEATPSRATGFEQLYRGLEIDFDGVIKCKHITDCFNLVLD